jgi:hypothetical protein
MMDGVSACLKVLGLEGRHGSDMKHEASFRWNPVLRAAEEQWGHCQKIKQQMVGGGGRSCEMAWGWTVVSCPSQLSGDESDS